MKKFFFLIFVPISFFATNVAEKKFSLLSFPMQPTSSLLDYLVQKKTFFGFFSSPEGVLLYANDTEPHLVHPANCVVSKNRQTHSFFLTNFQGVNVGFFALTLCKKTEKTLPIPTLFAVQEILKEFEKNQVDLILIFSELPIEEDQAIIKNFPQIDCILGYHSAPFVFGYRECTFLYKARYSPEEIHEVDLFVDKKYGKNLKVYPTFKVISLHDALAQNF